MELTAWLAQRAEAPGKERDTSRRRARKELEAALLRRRKAFLEPAVERSALLAALAPLLLTNQAYATHDVLLYWNTLCAMASALRVDVGQAGLQGLGDLFFSFGLDGSLWEDLREHGAVLSEGLGEWVFDTAEHRLSLKPGPELTDSCVPHRVLLGFDYGAVLTSLAALALLVPGEGLDCSVALAAALSRRYTKQAFPEKQLSPIFRALSVRRRDVEVAQAAEGRDDGGAEGSAAFARLEAMSTETARFRTELLRLRRSETAERARSYCALLLAVLGLQHFGACGAAASALVLMLDAPVDLALACRVLRFAFALGLDVRHLSGPWIPQLGPSKKLGASVGELRARLANVGSTSLALEEAEGFRALGRADLADRLLRLAAALPPRGATAPSRGSDEDLAAARELLEGCASTDGRGCTSADARALSLFLAHEATLGLLRPPEVRPGPALGNLTPAQLERARRFGRR
jgi:hypothetical protein